MSERSDLSPLYTVHPADAINSEEAEDGHSRPSPGVDIQQSRRRTSPARAAGRDVDPQLAAILRIEALLTLLAKRSIQPLLVQELKDPIARKIYEATGDKTVREIAEEIGVGLGTISRMWSRWEVLGMLTKEGTRYRRVV